MSRAQTQTRQLTDQERANIDALNQQSSGQQQSDRKHASAFCIKAS